MKQQRDEMFQPEDEESRIRDLKKQLEESAEGDMLSVEFDVPGTPPGVREQFWKSVLAWEKAPWTSQFEQLTREGVELPPPEQLDDAKLSSKLWEIVNALAERNVFLDHIDHLSDRQLYESLYHETLHEATKDVPLDSQAFSTIDMVGSDHDNDVQALLKFYADDEQREEYRGSFPEGLPHREAAPFDRDRHLPRGPEEGTFADQMPIEEDDPDVDEAADR